MKRQPASREPAFGSDSFLDVTANVVGVLIILIVLVGLRTTKTPPRVGAVTAELDRRVAQTGEEVAALRAQRDELTGRLVEMRQTLSAEVTAIETIETRDEKGAESAGVLRERLTDQQQRVEAQRSEVVAARSRLVSLGQELGRLKAAVPAPQKLVYRSPLSRPVEAGEIQFEIRGGRVTFIDLKGLLDQVKGAWKGMETELRDRGRATGEAGPLGAFRLRFVLAREDMPFTQSLLYGNGSFRGRMVEWQLLPVSDPRGEPVQQAIGPSSQFETVLARYSPNKFAVTFWVNPDSFAAFRLLRDHLYDRGYAVAARPLPPGQTISGSVYGSRSLVQ